MLAKLLHKTMQTNAKPDMFVARVTTDLLQGGNDLNHTKKNLERLAAEYGITDKTEVKELTELAIVIAARKYAHSSGSVRERYEKIVALYQRQVNLSHRTSQSILLQQYSTPAPIGYIMGVFCGIDKETNTGMFFEPSAGNGLLTIAGATKQFVVNEIDAVRRSNLEKQDYVVVSGRDATIHLSHYHRFFDAVLTNPPFGALDTPVFFDDYRITSLEHLMALRALDCMKDAGRAAIIIGGHTVWDEKGRIQSGRNRIFFNFLYSRYYVLDVINIDGKKLYSRQGTAFNTRLILISGRKPRPEGVAPLYRPDIDVVIHSFDELFERVMSAVGDPGFVVPDVPHVQTTIDMKKLEKLATALTQKLKLHIGEHLDGLSGRNYITKRGDVNEDTMFREWSRMKQEFTETVILFEEPTTFMTFDIDAIILSNVTGRIYIKCHGFPYFATFGLIKEDRYKIKKQLKDAGYDVMFVENERAKADSEKPPKREETQQDIGDYLKYLEAKDYNSRNILLLKRGKFYVTWDQDAAVIDSYVHDHLLEFRSFVKDAQLVKGVRFRHGTLKKYLRSIEKGGYNIIISDETLGAPYIPSSQACVVLDTQVPDSMAYETHSAVDRIRWEVGGDMDNFVRHRLGYTTKVELCRVLSAEQIDAVSVAIYNIEARGQGMIIGDQTGIGKGRIAASIIRYAVQQGLRPVFLTEKANLFSDIYRDLVAIGSGHLRPFIVNGRESKTDIKDEDGNVVYQAPEPTQQKEIIASRELPAQYDFVVATYSQFNSQDKKPEKPSFLRALSTANIFIMDEAHNSSGASNTGTFMQGIVADTRGVVFLSATFAKRPDNMPIYAMKTAISDCTMSKDQLVEAITKGGVALQEVLSAQLVSEGQMLRRERSFEGVEVNYTTLDDLAEEHRAIADNITEILRDIIAFQKTYIDKKVEELDDFAAAEGKEVELREGSSQAGVDNMPYFSKVFQVINQMLFSLKADAVADRAILRLKEGKKPVIAFASTMGSFVETLENETGMPVSDGDTINADFSEVLWRGLDGVLRYTEKDVNGKPVHKMFSLTELGAGATMEYERIAEQIRAVSTGITISPIDVIVQKLKNAGYIVAEVTGRKYELQLNRQTGMGLVLSRKRINTNDAFRKFNNNEVDVLLINQSCSTGASAHAIPTSKVPKDQVRQRVMIVLQAELDISTEVQKRGRINRTGQILKPIYDYVTSAIPAEKRLMMMLQKKLKSLDANTTSNQKQSTKILDVPDFLNKYGDKIVKEFLIENPEINVLLDDPLRISRTGEDDGESEPSHSEDAAHRVSGRVAVLSTKMQADFYNEVSQRYQDYVEYLKQIGEYDLEVEEMNLEAETTNARVVKMGNGAASVFGTDSILETVKANVLRKPFNRTELENLIVEALKDGNVETLQQQLITTFEQDWQQRLDAELAEVNTFYDGLIHDIPNEKKIKKLAPNTEAWHEAVAERQKELFEAKEKRLLVIRATSGNKRDYMQRLFRFFHTSRFLNYPLNSFAGGREMIPAVFLGFAIDFKKKKPFVPSQVKLRFAIASSTKYMVIPASMSAELFGIIGASVDLAQPDMENLLTDWETYVKQSSVDRKTRHIVTGNLLQAFSDFRGKLVSYTTIDGQTKKGILMPEYWDAGEQIADKVTVPIIKAFPLIASLVNGGQVSTDNGLSFFRKGDRFRVIVSGSRQRAGDIFLDKDLLVLVDGGNFEKVSNNMSAWVDEGLIKEFVQVLGTKHGLSVTLNGFQFRQIEQSTTQATQRGHIVPPPPVDEQAEAIARQEQQAAQSQPKQPDIDLLELEAKALIIKLKLQMHLAA